MSEILPIEDSPSQLNDHGPVFILGCPRSGTTFLANCIGGIELVEMFIGVLAPPRLMHQLGKNHQENNNISNRELLEITQDIFWQSFWRRCLYRHQMLIEILKKRKKLLNLFQPLSIEKKLFAYKEPFLCFGVKPCIDFFPNAKFIHIIRDGRDNADSMLRSYPHALSEKVLTNESLAENKNSEIGSYTIQKGW